MRSTLVYLNMHLRGIIVKFLHLQMMECLLIFLSLIPFMASITSKDVQLCYIPFLYMISSKRAHKVANFDIILSTRRVVLSISNETLWKVQFKSRTWLATETQKATENDTRCRFGANAFWACTPQYMKSWIHPNSIFCERQIRTRSLTQQ